ncbi:MAG: hypothetical protein R8K48_05760 [Gallionella sp.]
MKTVNESIYVAYALLIVLALNLLMLPQIARAAVPQLEKSIQQGAEIFSHKTFEGNGRVCASCHLAGGHSAGKLPNGKVIPSLNNAATIFPRYRARDNKVITLSGQVRSCVAGGLQGKPPAYGSVKLNAVVSYITSLSQGKAMEMGGKPQ